MKFKAYLISSLLILAACPMLHATVVSGRIADADTRAVSGATVTFQMIQMRDGATPAKAVHVEGVKSYYATKTKCDGSFTADLTGNDKVYSRRTLWQVRVTAPGFALGPYNYLVSGSKLDLNILTPRGALPKPKVYWGIGTPPFRYSIGCHIRRIVSAFL